MQKKECIICYRKCNKEIDLNLTCECKYAVHKKCFMKWFKLKPECIICHEKAYALTQRGKELMEEEWLERKIEKIKCIRKCNKILKVRWNSLFSCIRLLLIILIIHIILKILK